MDDAFQASLMSTTTTTVSIYLNFAFHNAATALMHTKGSFCSSDSHVQQSDEVMLLAG